MQAMNIMRIKTILESPAKRSRPFLTFLGFLLVLAIGSLDTIMSYDISVSVLYLLPIMLIAWFEGGAPAAFISILCAITWAVADLASGHVYSHIGIEVWNAVMILALFLIVAYFVVFIKKLLIREHHSSGKP